MRGWKEVSAAVALAKKEKACPWVLSPQLESEKKENGYYVWSVGQNTSLSSSRSQKNHRGIAWGRFLYIYIQIVVVVWLSIVCIYKNIIFKWEPLSLSPSVCLSQSLSPPLSLNISIIFKREPLFFSNQKFVWTKLIGHSTWTILSYST